MSSLSTSTTYSPRNQSILSVVPYSKSQYSVVIPAAGVRSIFDYALNSPSTGSTARAIELIVGALQQSEQINSAPSHRLGVLRRALGMTIAIWGMSPGATPGPVPITGNFASAGYRLVVYPPCRTLFVCLSSVTLVWCLFGLLYCWLFGSPSPNNSRFPELDFAARVTADTEGGGPVWLAGLGNATSLSVRKRIQGEVLYVGSLPSEKGLPVDRVVIGTKPGLEKLTPGQPYL